MKLILGTPTLALKEEATEKLIAYVVTAPCIQCKHTNCAAVCPVDAFREGPNFLVIDPFECIDCDACVAECPVEAIYPDDEVPMEWEDYINLNDRLSEEWADHVINEAKDALPEAEAWADKENKRKHLVESWDTLETSKPSD